MSQEYPTTDEEKSLAESGYIPLTDWTWWNAAWPLDRFQRELNEIISGYSSRYNKFYLLMEGPGRFYIYGKLEEDYMI